MLETRVVRQWLPGVLLSGCLAAAATAISARYGAPAMLMGLLLGMACHFLSELPRFAAGLEWVSGPALRIGVALLGVSVAFSDLA
ncbi:MAG: putative sulfate exporter family transporter, partial [Halieaceae bacterium]